MADDYVHRDYRRRPAPISLFVRFVVGMLIPVLFAFGFWLLYSSHRHRTSGPEGGFEQFGYAMVSLRVLAGVAFIDWLILFIPFRSWPALLITSLIPVAIGVSVIMNL